MRRKPTVDPTANDRNTVPVRVGDDDGEIYREQLSGIEYLILLRTSLTGPKRYEIRYIKELYVVSCGDDFDRASREFAEFVEEYRYLESRAPAQNGSHELHEQAVVQSTTALPANDQETRLAQRREV